MFAVGMPELLVRARVRVKQTIEEQHALAPQDLRKHGAESCIHFHEFVVSIEPVENIVPSLGPLHAFGKPKLHADVHPARVPRRHVKTLIQQNAR